MAGLGVALACYALLGARAQSGPACLASGTCPSVAADFRDSSLLQRSHDLSVSFTRKPAKGSRLMQSSWFWRRKVTSDCASRLGVHYESPSACVVTRNNEALLVWVPYGSAPGWDLPGGMKKRGESACETAERETCEETGYKVRALERLSDNVFRCEIVAARRCWNPVDEGFLHKKWMAQEGLTGLQYRGGTWGDKQGFLRRTLQSSGLHPQSGEGDMCGCDSRRGEGYSSSRRQCAVGSTTEAHEACACARRSAAGGAAKDVCGCTACSGEGWSSSRGQCAPGSHTDAREASACEQRAGAGTLAPPGGLASDCAQRLGVHYEASSACVVKRNDEALLVWVPYDSAPGWDLPGGMKNSGESACETAERETCEETGFQVRAVEKLSGNVFRCEIVSANKCTNAVDEGFLKKKWATKADLGSLQYRGGTWGNKQGFLRQTLQG
uniref:Nudix hydrolase domain-containing protein n=1 Tax=Zooxanthella nutricula TaxID=1333877 RepID=A0A7S2NMG7_9DINO|mmetsp:Transcript_31002/g.93757  ORF Transcript_31002/g.93757 Transcript_31002/m.93757 type:complete len:441 (+) Transcript_31002:85-1407(+)